MRKLINNSDDVVDEVLDGILTAHPGSARVLHGPAGFSARNSPRAKTALLRKLHRRIAESEPLRILGYV